MKRFRHRLHLLSLLTLLAALPALVMVFTTGPKAAAHGAPMTPGSRTFLCWQDGLTSTGEIKPQNPACAAAQAVSGTTPFYNWFSVLRSDGAGRTRGFVPDGELCSGGNTNFTGFNLPRTDWPLTHLTSGATYGFTYNSWAAHPGTFIQYVTKDGFDASKTFTWDALESSPFYSVTDPPKTGSVGTVEGKYSWTTKLPAGKSGRHIIYTVWQRSDSTETFYSCSDVTFDGGNGEVTGVGGTGTPTSPAPSSPAPSSPAPSSPAPSSPAPSSPAPSSPAPGSPSPTVPATDPSCSAVYRTVGSWNGGYQGEVTVKNTGSHPILGWMAHFTLPSGQTLAQVWNGVSTGTGAETTIDNASWNGSLAAGGTTTFGFLVNGGAPSASVTYSCMVM
ncbi:chitin-binding protein [Kitasatospora sp. NE20-6]|uniref:lytic polysaccharide monooxygenase n=1 Tax=Kitasatospora sp. NE20-6 TaxID=2859066 RepID=UPI0034DC892C